MAKTVGQVISWVDQMLPNGVDSTTKMIFIEDIYKTIKHLNTECITSDTTPTASSQADYDLPSGVDFKDLMFVGISPTTFNTTNIVGSTTPFVEYSYKSWKNAEVGMQYWENSSSNIRLASIPDDAYHMRFKYLPSLICNASTDSTTFIPGNDFMVGYCQNKLASQVAKMGSFPRIDLANNYELESDEFLNKARVESMKFKLKRKGYNMSYKDWWDD
jgi:hypothetical protein